MLKEWRKNDYFKQVIVHCMLNIKKEYETEIFYMHFALFFLRKMIIFGAL